MQTVVQRLLDERVVRNFTRPRQIFRAGDLVGEEHGDEILGRHALDLWRRALAAGAAADGERDARIPAPARGEHRRVEHRLYQRVFHGLAVEEPRHARKIEAVRLAERQHDGVFRGRCLQLEVERAAEFLAQREAEGTVDARAVRRVDDELLSAGFIEEPLEDQRVALRKLAEHGFRGSQIFDHLLRCRVRQVVTLDHDVDRARDSAVTSGSNASISARRRETDSESSSVRAGASPSQNGMLGGWPFASSTRTRPASTRRMRYDVLPSWKMSPARLSMAKSSLSVPTKIPVGSRITW